MKHILVAMIVLALSPAVALGQESRSDLFSQQPGRYQIVINPSVRADTFLVDTATGRVWMRSTFVFLNGEPDAWNIMTRLDSVEDRIAFIERIGRKPEAPPSKPSAAAGPPVRLQ
jgi:hypothetical protein